MSQRAGERIHKMSLQKDTGSTYDANGQVSQNWLTQAVCMCGLHPLAGQESPLNDQIHATVAHEIETLRLASVSPTAAWRLLYGSRVFHIISVVVQDRDLNRDWLFTVNEQTTGAT